MARVLRSIGAVLAGAVVGVALSVGTDALLMAAGVMPREHVSDGLLALATLYRTVYGVLGAYVTARLAPSKPMTHAMVLGAIGVVASIAGVVANKSGALGPMWYPWALVVLALPQSWFGGWIKTRGDGSATV